MVFQMLIYITIHYYYEHSRVAKMITIVVAIMIIYIILHDEKMPNNFILIGKLFPDDLHENRKIIWQKYIYNLYIIIYIFKFFSWQIILFAAIQRK